MKQNKQQEILKLVNQKYYPVQQYLNLYNRKENWSNVLLVRDWSNLKKLSLSYCFITNDSISVLNELNFPQLSSLDLSKFDRELGGNIFNTSGLKCIIDGDWPSIDFLSLGKIKISDDGLLAILEKFKNKLKSLMINSCMITCTGMKYLVNCTQTKIRWLNLSSNYIRNAGVKLLTKVYLPLLQSLQIAHCQVESEGFKHLMKAYWPNLTLILLGQDKSYYQNKIQLNGWQALYIQQWKSLKSLFFFQGTSICLLNCVLIQKSDVKIFQYEIRISNNYMKMCIMDIIVNTNLME